VYYRVLSADLDRGVPQITRAAVVAAARGQRGQQEQGGGYEP
jgi:hypothetical protein